MQCPVVVSNWSLHGLGFFVKEITFLEENLKTNKMGLLKGWVEV